MKKQIATIFVLSSVLLFSIFIVAAQTSNQTAGQLTQAELRRSVEGFEMRYPFTCKLDCVYGTNNQSQATLRVREQKRFLFWNVNSEENYILDIEGRVVQARYNIWSRILNKERLKVE